ncbi:UvrD-helicase domain-containing protein [Roseateles puraquae]|uniref:UvrD-helicase domain-containing protein n=1 Tax=Roseateles puraquae TaxID=431059 RepID=UPI0031DD5D15
MELTNEQAHAVDLFKRSGSLKISAFAGTGKTSTLSALAKSTTKRGLYLAFNKSIAEEARARFPAAVDCRTTHSLALREIPQTFREREGKLMGSLQGNRTSQLLGIEEIAVGGITLKPRSLGYLTARTVQRFCQSGDQEVLLRHVPLSGKLDRISPEYQDQFKLYVSKLAAHLWERMTDPYDEAPLGHDGYLKLWSLSQPQLNYDFLLLDEAQDTNEAVLSVLRCQDSHLTLVGDKHQQIYEWRGAVNAMASVETDAEAFLTQSFRFGNAVAGAATSILRVLGESREVTGNPSRASRIASSGTTRAVLCRTNAGVITVVVEALALGRKPHVVGGVSDVLRMLDDVTRLKQRTPAEGAEFFGFSDWDEVVEFAESDEGESLRSFVSIVEKFGEVTLIRRLKTVEREESSADLVISTGHKAKGREWDSVTLHSDFDPRESKEDPKKFVLNHEEARLLYVAATRAKELLVVPPRLAAKWHVPAAPAPSQVQAPIKTALATKKKEAPPLPSFAKVVSPSPTPKPTLGAGVPAVQQKEPRPTPAPASIHTPARPTAPPDSGQGRPEVKSTAATTGLAAAVIKFFFG